MVKEAHNDDKPQPPKRPLSAFFLFRQDRYTDVNAANPNTNVAEITKIISEEWNKLSDERKQGYKTKYDGSKQKYDQELKDYVNKYGKVEKKKKIKRGSKDKDKAAGSKKANGGKKDADKKDASKKKQK